MSGRKRGSRNREYDTVEVAPVRCRKCGSTRRSRYFSSREREIVGVHQGRVYVGVRWRRTRCLDCGQYRVERSYVEAEAAE